MKLERYIEELKRKSDLITNIDKELIEDINTFKKKVENYNKKCNCYQLINKLVKNFEQKEVLEKLGENFVEALLFRLGKKRFCFGEYPDYTLRGKGLYYYHCSYNIGLYYKLDQIIYNKIMFALKDCRADEETISKADKYLGIMLKLKELISKTDLYNLEIDAEGIREIIYIGWIIQNKVEERKLTGTISVHKLINIPNDYFYIINKKIDVRITKTLKNWLEGVKETRKNIIKLKKKCNKIFALELSAINL